MILEKLTEKLKIRKKIAGKDFCINCEYLIKRENGGSLREWIWYNLFCKASPLVQELDPVSGQLRIELDDLYNFCRDINKDGNCPKYKGKKNIKEKTIEVGDINDRSNC